MPRTPRWNKADYVYHVVNRGAKKALLFGIQTDYRAFERLLLEAKTRVPMRILAYCLMPNHWHLLLWPLRDGDLSRFVQWLTTTHAARWNRAHDSTGYGAVYQSRFKSVPIEQGQHLYWTWRYVERNALRAHLVSRAEQWEWCSLHKRVLNKKCCLDAGPLPLPENWTDLVNLPQTETELQEFRTKVQFGAPFGHGGWLEKTKSIRGRPNLRKTKKEGLTPSAHV
jgi:putative transposase